jgi:hypothetical protein
MVDEPFTALLGRPHYSMEGLIEDVSDPNPAFFVIKLGIFPEKFVLLSGGGNYFGGPYSFVGHW